MKFENVLTTVKEKFGSSDISVISGKLALQFTLTGKDEGVFYAEVLDGVLSIEPYEYLDRDANIIMTNANFVSLLNGKLDPVIAYTTGKLKIEGDITKALEIKKLIK